MDCKAHEIAVETGKADFWANEDGAVTVDWVVLTATILFLGMASMFFVTSGVPTLGNRTAAYLSTAPIGPQ